MNTFKKIGLTALAGSLVAVSVNAAELSVTGGAGITFSGQDKTAKGNGWTMTDSMTFAGSAELDNGWTVSTSFLLDDSDSSGDTHTFDDRSMSIAMGDAGTITINGRGGSSAMGAVDDVMPTASGNETWDLGIAATGGTALTDSQKIGGTSGDDNLVYNNSSIVDGLSLTISYQPSDTAVIESTTSYAIAYTGVEGLTVGYGADENGLLTTANIEKNTMYAKYAYGPVTVGYQKSEADLASSTNDDEFSAMAISYTISDDLSVSYAESAYDHGDVAVDTEYSMIAASYTMGSMSLAVSLQDIKNIGGSTATVDDVTAYELALSFVF